MNLEGIEIREPITPVEEHEIVIGELPEELRPLWSLLFELSQAHETYHEMLERGQGAIAHTDPITVIEHIQTHAAMAYIHTVFRERLEHSMDPSGDYDGYAVRKGWKLVGVVQHPLARMGFIFMGAGQGGLLDF